MAVGSIAAEHTQFAMFLSRAFAAKSLALLIQRIARKTTEALGSAFRHQTVC